MLLREKDRHALIEIFSTLHQPIQIWAYGSRVNGTAHEGSDLDLVLRTPDLKPLPLDAFLELREKITDSNIPILVELMDWSKLPQSFHKNIEKEYEVLFDNQKTLSTESLKHILNEPPTVYKTKTDNKRTDNEGAK